MGVVILLCIHHFFDCYFSVIVCLIANLKMLFKERFFLLIFFLGQLLVTTVTLTQEPEQQEKHPVKNNFTTWLFKSHKMSNCPQVSLWVEAPANSTAQTHHTARMGIFQQSTPASIMSHKSQTFCSQLNSTVHQGPEDP